MPEDQNQGGKPRSKNSKNRDQQRRNQAKIALTNSLARHWEITPEEAKSLARRRGIPGFA